MKKSDTNRVLLAGKVGFAKSYDLREGATFTNGSIKLIVNDEGDFVWVKVFLSVDERRDEKDEFDRLCVQGRELILPEAFMTGYFKDKKAKTNWQFQLESKLFGIGIAPGYCNQATVSGTVSQSGPGPDGKAGLVLDALYDSRSKTNKWRTRRILTAVDPKLVKEQNIGVGDRVLVHGKVVQGDKSPRVESHFLSKIKT